MLPDELLQRANSAQISELMVHFKMLEDERAEERAVHTAEVELTSFFGEAGDDD